MRYDDWKSIVRESAPLIALMMLIEISGGGVLESMSEVFYAIPALLALVPLINAVGGNTASIIGSRLASGLHLGMIEPSFRDKEVLDNMFTVGMLGMIAKLITASLLFAMLPLLGIAVNISFWKWLLITFIATVIVMSVVIPAAVITSIIAFRKGKSPDDFTIPVVSTVGDISGIIAIVLAIKMVVP